MAKTLVVYLAADLRKFNSGLSQGERGLRGFSNSVNSIMGPALIGATAAAGALAVKLGVDGVQAAVQDEKAAASLAQTLTNLGLAHDVQPVEDYISSLERSLGIADDELRPAYDRLARSIGNTQEANRAMRLALDVAAGSGKSLTAVVEALGKGYDGNTAGLSRLGAGIDAVTLRSGDMAAITQELADTFGGQADIAASTYEGQLNRLRIAFDNVTEAFGYGFLEGLGVADQNTQALVDSMGDLEAQAGTIGDAFGNAIPLAMTAAATSIQAVQALTAEVIWTWQKAGYALQGFAIESQDFLGALGDEEADAARNAMDLAYAADEAGYKASIMAIHLGDAGAAASTASTGIGQAGDAAFHAGRDADTAAGAYGDLAGAMTAAADASFNWRREISGTADAYNMAIDLKYEAWVERQREKEQRRQERERERRNTRYDPARDFERSNDRDARAGTRGARSRVTAGC